MAIESSRVLAVLRHEVLRLESGGEHLSKEMLIGLLEAAESAIQVSDATIYRLQEDARQRASREAQNTK
jgi:hypothetical protein